MWPPLWLLLLLLLPCLPRCGGGGPVCLPSAALQWPFLDASDPHRLVTNGPDATVRAALACRGRWYVIAGGCAAQAAHTHALCTGIDVARLAE